MAASNLQHGILGLKLQQFQGERIFVGRFLCHNACNDLAQQAGWFTSLLGYEARFTQIGTPGVWIAALHGRLRDGFSGSTHLDTDQRGKPYQGLHV